MSEGYIYCVRVCHDVTIVYCILLFTFFGPLYCMLHLQILFLFPLCVFLNVIKGYHHVSVSAVLLLFLLHSVFPLFYVLLPIWHLNMCCVYLDSSNVTCFTFSVQSLLYSPPTA